MFGRSVRAESEERTKSLPGDELIQAPLALVHACDHRSERGLDGLQLICFSFGRLRAQNATWLLLSEASYE